MNKNTIGYAKGAWKVQVKKISFSVEGAFLYYEDEKKPWLEVEKICVHDSDVDISEILDDETFQKIVYAVKHIKSVNRETYNNNG